MDDLLICSKAKLIAFALVENTRHLPHLGVQVKIRLYSFLQRQRIYF